MQPSWLNHYPRGVPATIDQHAFNAVPEMIALSCVRFADLPAFSNGGTTLRYAELEVLSQRLAAWLQHESGLLPGDRIALMMPNLLQYPVALAAALRAGLVVVNVNPQYTARELEHQLADSGASAIVVIDTALPLVRQVCDATALRRIVVTTAADLLTPLPGAMQACKPIDLANSEACFLDVLTRGAALEFVAPVLTRDHIALLQYTGGTTGVSKGAILTHGNLVANLQQGAAWYGSALGEGAGVAVTIIPLYHIFGLTFNGLLMVQRGAHNRLVTNARDPAELFAALAPGFTVISGVNTLFNSLLNAPGIEQIDFSTLKLTVSGGASAQAAVVERWQQATGSRIAEGYGLTETSPFALANPVTTCYGGGLLPIPSTEAAIRDDAGKELPLGSAGEICIRGPQVMRGYWRHPVETAAALDGDGWLRTGDVGTMDARGAVTITDRKKDMVLVSGFNVFPNEIEAVLAQHPEVLECAVIGVPDPHTGEALKAFVVRRSDDLAADVLIEHCRKGLVAYKVPRQLTFVTQLPKSPVGKILRRSLRE